MGIRIFGNYDRRWQKPIGLLLLFYLWMCWPASAHAARIGDITELDWKEQTIRFLSLVISPIRAA